MITDGLDYLFNLLRYGQDKKLEREVSHVEIAGDFMFVVYKAGFACALDAGLFESQTRRLQGEMTWEQLDDLIQSESDGINDNALLVDMFIATGELTSSMPKEAKKALSAWLHLYGKNPIEARNLSRAIEDYSA